MPLSVDKKDYFFGHMRLCKFPEEDIKIVNEHIGVDTTKYCVFRILGADKVFLSEIIRWTEVPLVDYNRENEIDTVMLDFEDAQKKDPNLSTSFSRYFLRRLLKSDGTIDEDLKSTFIYFMQRQFLYTSCAYFSLLGIYLKYEDLASSGPVAIYEVSGGYIGKTARPIY